MYESRSPMGNSEAKKRCSAYNSLHYTEWLLFGVLLASEGWWEARQSPPQGNQELLVVRDNTGRPRWAWSKQVHGMWYFPSVFWHYWLGDRKGIQPVKKLDVGLSAVMIWLELCTTYSSSSPVVTTTSIILCFNKHLLTQVHLENGH